MSTAGYATKHTLSLIALRRKVKAPNRRLTEEQLNSFLLMERGATCG